MRKGLALVASLAGILALVVFLSRGERAPEAAPAASGPPGAASEAPRGATHSSATREPASPEPPPVQALRGRVLTADGAPLAGCDARLSYVERRLARAETDADGRFEFQGPLREGTVLALVGPDDWSVEPGELELDALPEEELAFVARLDASEQVTGPVRGVIVDEIDGTPLPYLKFNVGAESLETDAEGRFESAESHPSGRLEFSFASSAWDYELGSFHPDNPEPLVVPARVGPTLYVAISGQAVELGVSWSPETEPATARAFGLDARSRCSLRREAPSLVRLPGQERATPATGELVFFSVQEALFGRAALAAGRGTRETPLAVALEPCAFLGVEVENSGRDLEWYEDITLVLASRRGELLANQQGDVHSPTLFAVQEAGEYLLEARLDDELLAQSPVQVRLRERQSVKLVVRVPEESTPEEPEIERVPVSGRVTSARNRPTPGQIRLTRASDGEEGLLPLEWTKTRGRWEATFAGVAPVGELRAALELDPCFAYSGPRALTLPSAAELRYLLDDAVPLIDVYLVPKAAEDGTQLLSFDAALVLDDGDMFEGADFGSPSLPVAVGHPCNVPFTWLCISAGRGAASGRYSGEAEGGDVRIPITLARGWGAIVYVGGAHAEPLEGVEVHLDGVRVGVTGPDGHLALSGARPGSITFRYRDWQLEDGHVEPDGRFDDSQLYLNSYLAPPER